jgi:hypothetical protein
MNEWKFNRNTNIFYNSDMCRRHRVERRTSYILHNSRCVGKHKWRCDKKKQNLTARDISRPRVERGPSAYTVKALFFMAGVRRTPRDLFNPQHKVNLQVFDAQIQGCTKIYQIKIYSTSHVPPLSRTRSFRRHCYHSNNFGACAPCTAGLYLQRTQAQLIVEI